MLFFCHAHAMLATRIAVPGPIPCSLQHFAQQPQSRLTILVTDVTGTVIPGAHARNGSPRDTSIGFKTRQETRKAGETMNPGYDNFRRNLAFEPTGPSCRALLRRPSPNAIQECTAEIPETPAIRSTRWSV